MRFPATPGWVSLLAVVGAPRHSWLRVPGGVPRHSWLGSAGGGGVLCAAVVCWWGCGWCVVWWAFLATPGGGSRARFPATPGWVSLSAVVCGVWCVVCGLRRWCVGGVVAGVWCGWSLATPGGGSRVLLPSAAGWVSLPMVVRGPRHSWLWVRGAVPRHSWLGSAGGGGVWCVVCGGGVLVGCAVRLSALLVFVFPFVLFSFAKNPCCFSLPLKTSSNSYKHKRISLAS